MALGILDQQSIRRFLKILGTVSRVLAIKRASTAFCVRRCDPS
jgi:hypothetical protein